MIDATRSRRDLALVVEAWRTLPEHIRIAVLALVQTADRR
jgi:hypothetical protein